MENGEGYGMNFKEWMEQNEPDCSTRDYELAKKVWSAAEHNWASEPRWNDYSKVNPDLDKYVIAMEDDGYVYRLRLSQGEFGKLFWCDTLGYEYGRVTHWLEIPE